MRLPYDCERCNGSNCGIREQCLRHVALRDMGPRTPVNDHSDPTPVAIPADCEHFLEVAE